MKKTNGREFFGKNLSVEFAKKGGHKKDGYLTEELTASRHEFKPERETSYKKSPYNAGGGNSYQRGGNHYNNRKSGMRPTYNAPSGSFKRSSRNRSRSDSPHRNEKPRYVSGYNKYSRGGGNGGYH